MPERDHLRRLSQIWVKHPVYSITVCISERKMILAEPTPSDVLTESWRSAPDKHDWVIGRYVIMPDHVHFFARPQPEGKTLSAFMRDWKKWTTKVLRQKLNLTAPVWQSEFFDHVLRTAESYSEKWHYVRDNPVRAGFVTSAEAWPFSGEWEVLTF